MTDKTEKWLQKGELPLPLGRGSSLNQERQFLSIMKRLKIGSCIMLAGFYLLFYWKATELFLRVRLTLVLILVFTLIINPTTFCIADAEVEYALLHKDYPWLTDQFYMDIKRAAMTHKLYKFVSDSTNLVCAIIQVESGGKNVVSGPNYDGSFDWGFMQVNEKKFPSNPRKLLKRDFNLDKGCEHLYYCFKASHGNLLIAFRKYNRGLNSGIYGEIVETNKGYRYAFKVYKVYAKHQIFHKMEVASLTKNSPKFYIMP